MTTQTTAVETHRLTNEAYKALEAQLRTPIVSASTSDTEAGYLLGIQHVLKLLREGYVIGR